MIKYNNITDTMSELIKLMNAEQNTRFVVTRAFDDPEWRVYTETEWRDGGRANGKNDDYIVLSLNRDEIGKIYEEFGADLKLRNKNASLP